MSMYIDETPALLSLAALLPESLASLDRDVVEALGRDDYSQALKHANEQYAGTEGKHLVSALTYAILLTHRELADEALGVLRSAMAYNTHDVALQLAQVDTLFAAGEYDAAVALMDALRAVPMKEARHWAYLGDMFWDIEARPEAREAYEEAALRDSDDPDVALRLADLYADDGRFWEAAEQFERAGRLSPSDPHIWLAVTEAWMGLEAWDRALHAAKRTTKLDPDNSNAWALLGSAHRESGDPGSALRAFEKARNLDPEEPVHWLNLGGLQLEIGLPDEARQSYQRASRLNTSDIEAANGMVAAAYDLGDVELALRLAREAVGIDPENPDALYNLGVISLAIHRADEARDAFERAAQVDADNPHVVAGLATAVLLEGDIETALELMEEALRLEPEDAELVLEFAQFLFRHGGADIVLDFVPRAGCTDPTWNVVAPVLEFLAHALRRDAEPEDDVLTRFVEAVRSYPESIPVMWDFDELERLGYALEDDHQRRLLDMLAVLDGRLDVDALADLAA